MHTKTGEYFYKGDYHLELDPKWRYLPVYLCKLDLVRNLLNKVPKEQKILDVGCGEGRLVNEYREKGNDILGVDFNYESESVDRGDVCDLKYQSGSYDVVLCLDLIEHLDIANQEKAISELNRVLKKDGKLIVSLPNLAHFASRMTFLFFGRLLRTSTVDRHPGDRPIDEFIDLLGKHFVIRNRFGLFPTFPLLCVLTWLFPARSVFLHRLYNKYLAFLGLCFLNVFEMKKVGPHVSD